MNKIIILLALFLIPFVYASDYGVHWEDTEINVNTPDYGVHWEDTEINVNTLFGNLTNLSEMADVNIPSPTDKQLFQFLTSDNKWHPYSFLLSDWWSYDYGDLINTPTSLSDFINDLGIGDWATDKPDYSTTTEADTLYYGIGNPSGFYNSTDFSITDYSTTANIISFDYYNSTDFNITDYFTKSEALDFNYYNSSDFSISDYFTAAQVLGFDYYNSTTLDLSGYVPYTGADSNVDLGANGITASGSSYFKGLTRFTGAVTGSPLGYDRLDLGVIFGTPRLILEDKGATDSVWQIDNYESALRFAQPGENKIAISQDFTNIGYHSALVLFDQTSIDIRLYGAGLSSIKNGLTIGFLDVWNAVGREIFNVNGNLWMTGNNDSIILGAGKQAQTWFDGLDWNFVNGQSGGEFNFYNQTGYGVPQIYAVLNAHDFVTHSFNATDKNTLELFTEEQTIWDVYRNQTDMNRPVIKTKCEWQLKEDFIKLNKTEWLKVDNVVAVNKTSIKKCWNETTYPFHISVKGTSQGQRSEDMEATLKQLNKGLNIIQIENETAIDTQIILANEIYTKSKVPDVKGKYFNLFDSSIYSKLTHFAYTSINGQPRLNQETRDVAQEGYLACDRECTLVAKETNKFKDYLDCKVGC